LFERAECLQNLQQANANPAQSVPAAVEQQELNLDPLEALIQQKERELRPLKWRMEELRIQFMNEFNAFAANWYNETARHYVTKYPEITLSLSKEKLASLKAKVNHLSANANKFVKNAFSDPKIWWHQSLALHDDVSQYEQLGDEKVGTKVPSKIDVPVRRALGELGVVLEQFGFRITTIPALKASFPEFWFRAPEDPMADAHPYYPHILAWSEEMKYTIQRYNAQFKQAIIIYKEIQLLKDQKKQQQASSLWDST